MNSIMDEISAIKKVKISTKQCFVEPWMTRGLENLPKGNMICISLSYP